MYREAFKFFAPSFVASCHLVKLSYSPCYYLLPPLPACLPACMLDIFIIRRMRNCHVRPLFVKLLIDRCYKILIPTSYILFSACVFLLYTLCFIYQYYYYCYCYYGASLSQFYRVCSDVKRIVKTRSKLVTTPQFYLQKRKKKK